MSWPVTFIPELDCVGAYANGVTAWNEIEETKAHTLHRGHSPSPAAQTTECVCVRGTGHRDNQIPPECRCFVKAPNALKLCNQGI